MQTDTHTNKEPQINRYNWKYILTVAREHKPALITANIVALFAVLATVPIPLLMPLLVDEVLLNQPGALVAFTNMFTPEKWHGSSLYILTILGITVCLRITGLYLTVWQTRQFTFVSKDITYRIRHALLYKLQRISMSEYEVLGSGLVSSHFVTDINAIDEFIGASISKALIAILSLIGITIILLLIHWQLALFILFMNPLVIYFTVVLGKKVKTLKKKENSAYAVFQQSLIETLDGIQQIRASNREKHYIQRVADKAKEIKQHSASFSWRSDAANRLSFGIFLIGFDVFRALSMLLVVFSDLTVGEMMAVFGYLWFMTSPVQEILNIQYAYFAANAALARINNLLGLQQEPQYPHNKNPFNNKETVAIKIENIQFAYGDNEPVLNGVNLNINRGEKVALVGASGGGKSTLVQVILGMYPHQKGMVYFNDIPVTEIGLDVVRDNVATVLQHPAMFNESVRNNLTLGINIEDEKIWQALEVAQLKKAIKALSSQLDTIIGHDGIRLSGGQLQRLAIARMLLSEPKVVILDEATSALDAHTEKNLHVALNNYLQDKTTLIIAHRLSAVKQADRVYVFEDGHIIEQGSHDELIQNKGLYSRLYGGHHNNT